MGPFGKGLKESLLHIVEVNVLWWDIPWLQYLSHSTFIIEIVALNSNEDL